ncbi:MAG: hypothetical protein VX447_04135 [Pseudomonadota bacterium]|uniref:hypothetical protein n=1 Tax=Gallaecimonas pentaromativorans TaxID=584787 RepID=UPI00067F22BA|nr:hypothetical protein [Gallaecimonas pentaromativorans]MED5523931.1 hypothetical protein [Pseudomonadota bacterium]
MLVLLATITFFGQPSWECSYHNDYPEHSVRETAIGQITYESDLSYVSKRSLIYSNISTGQVFAKFTFQESGKAHIQSSNEFFLDGHAYNFTKELDPTNHFPDSYLQDLDAFFNKELPMEEKVLKVVNHAGGHMEVLHEKSGTVTKCQVLPKGI